MSDVCSKPHKALLGHGPSKYPSHWMLVILGCLILSIHVLFFKSFCDKSKTNVKTVNFFTYQFVCLFFSGQLSVPPLTLQLIFSSYNLIQVASLQKSETFSSCIRKIRFMHCVVLYHCFLKGASQAFGAHKLLLQ